MTLAAGISRKSPDWGYRTKRDAPAPIPRGGSGPGAGSASSCDPAASHAYVVDATDRMAASTSAAL